MISDTERFYAAITKQLGGTRSWQQLNPMEQTIFIQSLNAMLQVCSQ